MKVGQASSFNRTQPSASSSGLSTLIYRTSQVSRLLCGIWEQRIPMTEMGQIHRVLAITIRARGYLEDNAHKTQFLGSKSTLPANLALLGTIARFSRQSAKLHCIEDGALSVHLTNLLPRLGPANPGLNVNVCSFNDFKFDSAIDADARVVVYRVPLQCLILF
ncbi:uncharacterized protein LY79DRAFT_215182 [Colletotrichum navitas]|uniref:Uncharacterized protein n=1 Tax=Colletotrichum navitas TaxID=681940 RepID=A0AAD8PYT8_9PEZI|nr:uncharacterized protein LY79DRAFT_215182 [Colletotrichum navitas]KAK1590609.1 hypothetical protein LY79DRAFT_215182 [Colletotrichum navitas]